MMQSTNKNVEEQFAFWKKRTCKNNTLNWGSFGDENKFKINFKRASVLINKPIRKI